MRKIGKSVIYIGILIALITFAVAGFALSNAIRSAHADDLPLPEFRIAGGEGLLTQEYGSYTPIHGAFYGANGEQLTEEVWLTPILENSYLEVNNYPLKAQFPGNQQYAATTKEFTLVITRRPVHLLITGSYDFTYDGLPHIREWELDGTLENDKDPGLTVLYNGSETAVDVGTYAITMRVSNPNFCAGVITGGAEMRINPRNLTVGVDSLAVTEGETPQFKFLYSGFATGEDEKVLTKLPSVSGVFTEPGEYQLVPAGAAAKNYNLTYTAGSLTVNRKQIVAEVGEGLPVTRLEGVFSPSAFAVLSEGDRNGDAFSSAQKKLLSGKLSSKLSVDAYYHLEISEDKVGEKFIVKLSNLKYSSLASYHVAVVDRNGNLYSVDKSSYHHGTLTFLPPSDGDIIIYHDYTVLICIVSAIAFLVLMVVSFRIAERYRYKRAKLRAENRPEKRKPKYIW